MKNRTMQRLVRHGMSLFVVMALWMSFEIPLAQASPAAPFFPSVGSYQGALVRPLSCESGVPTVALSLPGALVGLIPLIGNAVVFSSRSVLVRRVWGIIGLIVGTVGSVLTTAIFITEIQGVCAPSSFDPTIHFLNPLALTVHLTGLLLSIFNLIRSSRDAAEAKQQVSFAPWVRPSASHGTATGLMMRGIF